MNVPVPTVSARRRAPAWLWVLGVLSLLAFLAVAAGAAWLSELDAGPVHVVIDGSEEWSFDLGALSAADRLGLAVAAVLVLAVVVLVVPFALVVAVGFALLGAVCAVLFGVGLPLAAMLLALVLVTSPLWLLAALLWWLWRRSASPAAKIAG